MIRPHRTDKVHVSGETAIDTSKLPDASADPATYEDHSEGFYKHCKRPEWGYAIQAWEKARKRAYQFEDGSLRVLRQGFYSLMLEVDPPQEAGSLLRGLRRLAQQGAEAAAAPAERKPTLASRMPWSDQLVIFRAMYPEGFEDDQWVADCRGLPTSRRLKRHREVVIKDAQELLTEEKLAEAQDNNQHAEMIASLRALLGATNLVGARYVEALGGLNPERTISFTDGIRELLYGPRKFGARFGHWLDVHKVCLGGKVSWGAATVLPALVFPDKHVCVHKTAFLAQAGELGPGGSYSKSPTLVGYASMQTLAQEAAERLRGEGMEPRDLIDVRDFIEVTLRPSAIKHLPT